MFQEIGQKLDDWVAAGNAQARGGGWTQLRPCTIKVLGQMALMEAGMKLALAATKDVDVYADYDHSVEKEFARLLASAGYELDPVGHEVWMPRETRYTQCFKGRFVQILLAEPEAVLLSKALKAPAKNGPLLVEYLATGASDRFLDLAGKYHLDLEQFL
jgi:hypothetical protein